MRTVASLFVRMAWFLSIALLAAGCSSENATRSGSSGNIGPDKDVHSDLFFQRLTDSAKINQLMKNSDVCYLGQDEQNYHCYAYSPMKNGRLQVSVFSIEKKLVNQDEFVLAIHKWTKPVQQPCPIELMEWGRARRIERRSGTDEGQ